MGGVASDARWGGVAASAHLHLRLIPPSDDDLHAELRAVRLLLLLLKKKLILAHSCYLLLLLGTRPQFDLCGQHVATEVSQASAPKAPVSGPERLWRALWRYRASSQCRCAVEPHWRGRPCRAPSRFTTAPCLTS
jgi:hypothetical protein